MRLLFIPGFGEDESIFDKIHPHLPGEKVFLNNWELVGDKPKPGLTVLQYARELVVRYGITEDDVVIGHSMGGWIALHIKHLVHCPIVQIASWTEDRKIVRPIKNQSVIYWSVRRGLYFNPLVKQFLIWKNYRKKPSAPVFSSVFDRLRKGNPENVVNQLQIIFNKTAETVSEKPDLRIHARRDTIIRFPDEPCCEVPGDHFTLYTHPEKVYVPLVDFLQQLRKGAGGT